MISRWALSLIILLLPSLAQAQLKVLVTIKPLQLIAAAVMGGAGDIDALIAPGQSPHHYALKPSDRTAMADANLIIWIGEDLETYLTSVMSSLAGDDGRNRSVLRLDQLESLTLLPLRADHGNAAHADRMDPHLWLHSGNASAIAAAIAGALGALDPARAADYQTNARNFGEQLMVLHDDLAEELQALQQQPFLVYHDAIQYFELEFGLQHALALVPDPEQQPGIRHIMQTRNAIERLQAGCLLTDNTANPHTIETMLGGHRLKQVELDLLGFHVMPDADGYSNLMRRLAADISSCLSP
ncbi:MAG: hypothetical protein RLZZ385_721 [Pseudomonadota bacterium]|jgi:zinc transport system substrate-binding protein